MAARTRNEAPSAERLLSDEGVLDEAVRFVEAALEEAPGRRRNPPSGELADLVGQEDAAKLARLGLAEVARMTEHSLLAEGVSKRSARLIRAAVDFAVAAARAETVVGKPISDPEALYLAIRERIALLNHEEVWAVYVNKRNVATHEAMIARGAQDATTVDTRIIMREALLRNALGFFVAHNHPSGNPEPSPHDVELTHRLREAGRVVGVKLVDHLVVTNGMYVSLQERGQV